MDSSPPQKLVVVSNRIPVSFTGEAGRQEVKPSSGGLVSALEPVLTDHGGVWLGSVDGEDGPQVRRLLAKATRGRSFHYEPVFLTREEQKNFYEGFSNEVIWPLFHDLQSRCRFDPVYWKFYLQVNQKFARAIAKITRADDLIWMQDYQLMQVAKMLRAQRSTSRLAFFLHIPFPAPDIYEKLPWRKEILDGLLQHDLIGFQTLRDLRNFMACLRAAQPHLDVDRQGDNRAIDIDGRTVHAGFYPISVNFKQLNEDAASPEVEELKRKIQEDYKGIQIALGVDRLDYTKGIPERLRAFGIFLRDYPDFRRKVTLFQVVVPSRENIGGYRRLKEQIERVVARVNGEFSEPGWIPINYMHRSVPREELLALYRIADLALVTPIKDGMNLVAKEYCAAKVHESGTLILSEFAGAAPELKRAAILVNPYDEMGVAEALNAAFSMNGQERRSRMMRLRAQIRHFDILHWRDRILSDMERV